MNDDTMERLLIDRALGALPADVDELLTAYLAPRPEARATGAELVAVVASARRVLADPGGRAAPLPPLDRERMAGGLRTRASVGGVASLAASLLIGFGVGSIAGRPSQRPEAHEARDGQRSAAAQAGRVLAKADRSPASPVEASEVADEFWSATRFATSAARSPSRPSAELRWTSPVSSPLHKGKS